MNLEQKTEDFKRKIDPLRLQFPHDLINEFVDYWTEPNKSGTKLRWELEKTWDTKRRLQRWANNNFQIKPVTVKGFQTEVMKKPENEIERLDEVLMKYSKHPTSIEFTDLAKHYDYLKENKLMKKFTQAEISHISNSYSDKEKCRAACVVETFKAYCNHGINFSQLVKKRNNRTGQ